MNVSSEISLDKLLREGKLKRQPTGSQYLSHLLEAAKRNYDAAVLLKGKANEAAFKLVYDALLQISRAVLLLNGYRPDDGEQHKTALSAAGKLLGEEFDLVIARIQKFRIKRNDCLYDPRGFISQAETEAIFKTAREFWSEVRKYLYKKNPQLELFEEFQEGNE
jgi:uncharacterized protein (UPF0332 family)